MIEDSGIVIKDEDLFWVFEKGYKGYNGRGFQKLSGIGLFLCKKLLIKIRIELNLNQGTRVFIKLY